MKIIIPSHKRAGMVTTHHHIANCLVCVPESQRGEYENFHAGQTIITHPDTIIGLSPKRQWILDTFKNEDVVMVDDDALGINRLYLQGKTRKARMEPEEAYDLICATRDTAEQLGAFLFGFCKLSNATFYNSFKPLRFGPYTYATLLGFRKGHRLHFPPGKKFVHQDDWVCLLNAYRHRYMYLDMRFHLLCAGYGTRAGGLQAPGEGQRTEATKAEAKKYILQHFGAEVWPRNKAGLYKVKLPYSV